MGSDELPTGGPEFGGGEVDFSRYMFGILVVLRFLMRGSMTLSEYLAGLEIFLLGRESSTAGSDSGSGSYFQFQACWWAMLSWHGDVDGVLRSWRGIAGSGVPSRHVEWWSGMYRVLSPVIRL